jgi:hypothetical protein
LQYHCVNAYLLIQSDIIFLEMDFDPEFEFDCPKWYDFAKDEDGEFEEW